MNRTLRLSIPPTYRVSPRCPISSRSLHLLHEIFTGGEKAPKARFEAIRKKVLPPAEGITLNSVDTDDSRLGNVTLKEALPHIKPSAPLVMRGTKDGRIIWRIKTVKFPSPKERLTYFKRAGRSKEFHLTPETSQSFLLRVMKKTHEFLLQGARVEFVLSGSKKAKETVDWTLQNRPDLRPDVILPAMPTGTQMLAHPCAVPGRGQEGRGSLERSNVHWAMEHVPSLRQENAPTPEWIKEMARWDVPLRLNPEESPKQHLKTMYYYSLAESGLKNVDLLGDNSETERELKDVDLLQDNSEIKRERKDINLPKYTSETRIYRPSGKQLRDL